MDTASKRLLVIILAIAVASLAMLGYRNHRRGAVARYFQSPQFFELANYLPDQHTNGGPNELVSLSFENGQVTVRVQVRTQEEFDRVVQASRRPGRPRIEHLVILWKGVEYQM